MRTLLLALLTAAAGCASAGARAAAPPAPAADLPAELRAAEQAFMEATRTRGAEGWASFFADSGAQLPNRGATVVGPAAIRRHMAGAFTSRTVRLRRTPARAEVSAGGDLGYTYGSWETVRRTPAGGERITSRGKYITVWKRGSDGRWKVAADGRNEEP